MLPRLRWDATMPENYIAFECCLPNPEWWYDIVEGIPDPLVKDGFMEVSDRPGLGVDFIVKALDLTINSYNN